MAVGFYPLRSPSVSTIPRGVLPTPRAVLPTVFTPPRYMEGRFTRLVLPFLVVRVIEKIFFGNDFTLAPNRLTHGESY